jgi:hypothetical protein
VALALKPGAFMLGGFVAGSAVDGTAPSKVSTGSVIANSLKSVLMFRSMTSFREKIEEPYANVKNIMKYIMPMLVTNEIA